MADEPQGRKLAAAAEKSSGTDFPNAAPPDVEATIRRIQELMWRNVGIVRSAETLRQALKELQEVSSCLPANPMWRCWEARNIHTTAMLIARSALARQESRGAHYRSDFPEHNDSKFLKHSIVRGDEIWFG